MMEHESKKIFHLDFVDKREVEGRSPNMEKKAFRTVLTSALESGLEVCEVVTDGSTTIKKILRMSQPTLDVVLLNK